jgi:hypothetical protein
MKIEKSLKVNSTLFLKLIVLVIGIAVLAVCAIILPMGIMMDLSGYYRPILLGLYIPAIPFFVALFKAYRLLGYIEENQIFSITSVNALRRIKHCAIVISLWFLATSPYIYTVADKDDAPGVILACYVIIFASMVIATFAAVMQKLIQNAVEIKSENDLTV